MLTSRVVPERVGFGGREFFKSGVSLFKDISREESNLSELSLIKSEGLFGEEALRRPESHSSSFDCENAAKRCVSGEFTMRISNA